MRTLLAITLSLASTISIAVEIHPENWKSCAVKPLTENGGESDWLTIPQWARASHLVKIYESPRILNIHGLCNEKFKRIVLCLPGGWDIEENSTDPVHMICRAFFDRWEKKSAPIVEIHPENWKPCDVSGRTDDAHYDDWASIPAWAIARHLVKIYDRPRALIIHGLCNFKFKRLVMCSPGSWEDAQATASDPAARVCRAYFEARDKKN